VASGALLLAILTVFLLQQGHLVDRLHRAPTITMDPDIVADQLAATPSFQAALEDFMRVVGVTEKDIKVRALDTGACTLCEMKENATVEPTQLTITEANTRIQSGYSFWLYVGAFHCAYYFAADGVRPSGCSNQNQ